jgi:hypothetical protein
MLTRYEVAVQLSLLNLCQPALDLTWYLQLSAAEVHQQILPQRTLSDVMVFLISHVLLNRD